MLQKLIINNVALIDCAQIEFKNGLNVLSGETGAGKSVIMESLNFVLGAKADRTLIRSGESECFVKAEFFIGDNPSINEVLDELDVDRDDSIIISRKFNVDGKNSIKINGNTVTAGMLKKLTAFLVDVHGQSEHFNLLKTSNQLSLIDKFGGENLSNIKETLSSLFSKYKALTNQIDALGGGDESQRLMRLDILQYQINEIENCGLKENEEDELKEIKDKLVYQERIISALNSVSSAVKDEGGLNDVMGNLLRVTSSVATLGKDLSDINERLNNVFAELDDLGDLASDLAESFDYSEYSLDSIELRLDQIKQLKKKYGNDYAEIQDFLSNAVSEKEKLENFNVTAEQLLKEKQKLEDELFSYYIKLSETRKISATNFTNNVLSELKDLGMSKSSFEVRFDSKEKSECKYDSDNGIDSVEFLFSANLGEPLKPLSAVISGGEMSRFMLAIKAQTAKYNDVETFVFDEIDTGISGVVAKIVAEKFAKISQNIQIVAITHLPQISAMADNNLFIEKRENGQKTITSVVELSEIEKINEITRLIGGNVESESARAHSIELIKTAQEYKKSLKKTEQ